jgi:cation/acetate symporter
VAVICLIVASVTYVIGQMKGVGVAFSRFLEVDYDTGLYIAWPSCRLLRGARRHEGHHLHPGGAVLRADPGLHHPGDLHLAAADRQPDPGLGLFSACRRLPGVGRRAFRCWTKLDQVVTDLGFNEYTDHHGTRGSTCSLYTLSLMIGTAGLPHVIIRFFTVPKVADARWSAGWALVFIALLYLTAPAVGAMARLNIITTMWPEGPQGEAVLHEELPDWFAPGRSRAFSASRTRTATAASSTPRATTNELVNEFNRDILVLANPEIAQLPGWVIALIAAPAVSPAALSTRGGSAARRSPRRSRTTCRASPTRWWPGVTVAGPAASATWKTAT